MDTFWKERINEHLEVAGKMLIDGVCMKNIMDAGNLAAETIAGKNKILLCGNGGSAADAQHIAAELSGRFKKDRPPLAAMAITANSSTVTAIGNDFGFNAVFARQVEAFGKDGDLLIAISTSGNSPNVIEAVAKAKEMGIKTVGLTGSNNSCELAKNADVCVCVPSGDTARIQEMHILIGHMICEHVENSL